MGKLTWGIVGAAVCVQVWLAWAVVFQPMGVEWAQAEERAPTWWLYNDTVHRFGPGGDFFAVYHAGVALDHARSPYDMDEKPPVTPYAYPFRYLPVIASTLGTAFTFYTPEDAYRAWGLFLEGALLIFAFLLARLAATRTDAQAAVLLSALCTPFLLELHMGQFTFIAAVFALSAGLLGEWLNGRPFRSLLGRIAGRLLEGGLLLIASGIKIFPLAGLVSWLRLRRVWFAAAIVALLAWFNLPYFLDHPDEWLQFREMNLDAPRGGLGTGNFSPLYAIWLIMHQLFDSRMTEAAFMPQVGLFHKSIVGLTALIVFSSRERALWAGVAVLLVANFVGYVHVWEHHMTGVFLAGLVVWVMRRKLAVAPGRLWSGAVLLMLALLALPTPFVFLDSEFDPHVWDVGQNWPLSTQLLLVACKALPLVLLWVLLLLPYLRAGFDLGFRRTKRESTP